MLGDVHRLLDMGFKNLPSINKLLYSITKRLPIIHRGVDSKSIKLNRPLHAINCIISIGASYGSLNTWQDRDHLLWTYSSIISHIRIKSADRMEIFLENGMHN